MDLLLQSDQLAAQTPFSRSRPGAPLSPTNNIPGSTSDSTTLTKTAFRKKSFHALYPRAEADLCRRDTTLQTSYSMSLENSFSRAKKTEELLKMQGADGWLQSRCSVPPAIIAELQQTPRGPLQPHSDQPHCNQLLLVSPASSRALTHPGCQRHPTVGSTSTSALGITSWPVHYSTKEQFRAECTMLPLARCNPAQGSSVCQPLSQLDCRRNT